MSASESQPCLNSFDKLVGWDVRNQGAEGVGKSPGEFMPGEEEPGAPGPRKTGPMSGKGGGLSFELGPWSNFGIPAQTLKEGEGKRRRVHEVGKGGRGPTGPRTVTSCHLATGGHNCLPMWWDGAELCTGLENTQKYWQEELRKSLGACPSQQELVMYGYIYV